MFRKFYPASISYVHLDGPKRFYAVKREKWKYFETREPGIASPEYEHVGT